MAHDESLTVNDGKVVVFNVTMTNDKGEVLEASSVSGTPLINLQGAGNVVPGLERGLYGRAVGDQFQLIVPPEHGYGIRSGPGPQPVDLAAFPKGCAIEPGMTFLAEEPGGQPIPLWVHRIEKGAVYVDTNHPLAGVTLHFDVEILAVRDATPDELAEGRPVSPDPEHGW